MSGLCSAHCRGCAHYYSDGLYSGCVYAANMEKLRPYPAGDGCKAKISRLEWQKQMRKPRTNWTPEMLEQLRQLVVEGLNDAQIADRMGLRAEAVTAKRRSLKQEMLSDVEELTEKMKKTLEGFVPVDLSGAAAPAVGSEPQNGEAAPVDERLDTTLSVTADAAAPSHRGEGAERTPFRDKPTELLYQLLLEASPDMAVRIDGAPIKEVSVSVKFDDAGKENHREIYLGF